MSSKKSLGLCTVILGLGGRPCGFVSGGMFKLLDLCVRLMLELCMYVHVHACTCMSPTDPVHLARVLCS